MIAVFAAVCLLLGLASCGEVAMRSLSVNRPSVSEREANALREEEKSAGETQTSVEATQPVEEDEVPSAEEKNEAEPSGENETEKDSGETEEKTKTPEISGENEENKNSDEEPNEQPNIETNGESQKEETTVVKPSSESVERCEVCGAEKKSGGGHLIDCPHYVSFEGKDSYLDEFIGYFGGFPEYLKEKVGAYSTTYSLSITHMTESDLSTAYGALNRLNVTFYEDLGGVKYANLRKDLGERIYEIELEIGASATPPFAILKITVSSPES